MELKSRSVLHYFLLLVCGLLVIATNEFGNNENDWNSYNKLTKTNCKNMESYKYYELKRMENIVEEALSILDVRENGPLYILKEMICVNNNQFQNRDYTIEVTLSAGELQEMNCMIRIKHNASLCGLSIFCPGKSEIFFTYFCSSPQKIFTVHDYVHNSEYLFHTYKKKFNKIYNAKENKMRYQIFKKNLQKIQKLNKMEMGSAIYGITEFCDMTSSEYRKRTGLLPQKHSENEIGNLIDNIPNFKLPRNFDWRSKNVISQVKNQGNCGSCWAFSVVGNVEGLHAIKTGMLEEYSEQELLDCDNVDKACNGGLMDNAYKSIENLGGLELETDYPYTAHRDRCEFNKNLTHAKIKGAVDLPKNETALALWLVANGPIAIGINANAMQFYRGGVSHPLRLLCRHNSIDHGVLIVGYGIVEYPLFNKTLPYWIVKNSWGPKWGEQGYYRVYRGDNTCGVNSMASSAVL